jgi:DNA-directed RNA polymerase subunit M/transcription elongation factor TFIIS
MKFCKHCGTALESDTHGALTYRCPKCAVVYTGKPEDTLMYSQTYEKTSSVLKFETLIRNVGGDMTNPLIGKPCPECGNKTNRYTRVGDAQNLVFGCRNNECNHSWRPE